MTNKSRGDRIMNGGAFCFGHFRLTVRERMLTKDGLPVHLGSRAFDLLLALVERAGETVNREELFDLVWPDVIVGKVNLRVHIALLRKALEDGRDGNRFIVSVSGRGYRFVAAVDPVQLAVPATPPTKSSPPSLALGLDRMLGRDTAIATLSSKLARRRFIAFGGPGGWGRTSVAFAIAHTLATDFDDAVRIVDFAGLGDSRQVPAVVASALGCNVLPHESLSSLLDFLRDKELLLMFDNCDDVFAGVTQLIEMLFNEAPLVHVLISSREALRSSQRPAITPDRLVATA